MLLLSSSVGEGFVDRAVGVGCCSRCCLSCAALCIAAENCKPENGLGFGALLMVRR